MLYIVHLLIFSLEKAQTAMTAETPPSSIPASPVSRAQMKASLASFSTDLLYHARDQLRQERTGTSHKYIYIYIYSLMRQHDATTEIPSCLSVSQRTIFILIGQKGCPLDPMTFLVGIILIVWSTRGPYPDSTLATKNKK